MDEFVEGQITAYCYMVKRGKPAAMITMKKDYLEEAIGMIKKQNLRVWTESNSENWEIVWIYNYPHILNVIKNLQQVPKNKADHWILGKLFGYDEQSIHQFLNTKL